MRANLDQELRYAALRQQADAAIDAPLTRDDVITGAMLGFVSAGWAAGWWAVHQVAVFWMAGGF